MLKDLAADGHTVFISSHLMSEMAQTAARLVAGAGPATRIVGWPGHHRHR
jgi:hypothetical protein